MKQKPLTGNGTKIFLIILFSIILILVAQQSGSQTINTDQQGTHNGYFYSFWNAGGGTVEMTLGSGSNYSVTWTSCNNFTCGTGWKPGSPRTVSFSGSFNGGSNGYLALYGWTKDSLVEYYVVENYGSWTPPGGTSLGTFTSDGGTYNIYKILRVDQPSIIGNATFYQYWSVRTSKRSSGTITFSNHIDEWANHGMILGSIWDYQIMETEGYHSSGSSDITVSEGNTDLQPSPDLAAGPEVYPNPVTDELRLTLPGSQSEVSLYSVTGARVMVLKTLNHEIKIDMTKFRAGVYILKIANEEKAVTKKIIKQ
jgi:hypothetical protein